MLPIPDSLLSGQKGTFIFFENFFLFSVDFLKPFIFLTESNVQNRKN